MKRLIVLSVIIICLSGLLSACTAKEASEDDLMWQKIAKEERARTLYLAGETAYKAGDLRRAIQYWSAVIETKPDSEHTAKCLTKARAELWQRTVKYVKERTKAGDTLSAYIVTDSVHAFIPDSKDIPAKLAELKSKLSSSQSEALTRYQEAQKCISDNDVTGAKKALAEARKKATNCACISDLSATLAKLPSSPATSSSSDMAGSASTPLAQDGSPEAVVRRCMNALIAEDNKTALSCYTEKSRKQMIQDMGPNLERGTRFIGGNFREGKEYVLKVIQNDGNKAIVLTQPGPQPSQYFRMEFYKDQPYKGIPDVLVKENGEWKMDYEETIELWFGVTAQ